MKVNILGNNQTASSTPLETFQYRLDDSAEAVALIAETLRKSYKYPIKTSVQEYLSNARDIHREHNIKTAIDVQIPTEINSEFFIRDYGTGLSKEQMKDYITFAKSTKRHSNLATGGFGFGSKSFFAYADSFTIISFYEGIKYIYRASCVRSKEGALTLVSQTATTEPSGLQVQVAVRQSDRHEFSKAVFRLKLHWSDQEINIINLNKEEYPKPPSVIFTEKTLKVWKRDESEQSRHSQYGRHNLGKQVFLIVDGIPYGVDNFQLDSNEVSKFFSKFNQSYTISIAVNTGALTISKYREYIESTPDNQLYIEKLLVNMIENFKAGQLKKFGKISISSFSEVTPEKIAPYLMMSNSTTADFKVGSKVYELLIEQDLYHHRGSDFKYSMFININNTNFIIGSATLSNRFNNVECALYDTSVGFNLHSDRIVFLPKVQGEKPICYYSVGESKETMIKRLKTVCLNNGGHRIQVGVISFQQEPTEQDRTFLKLIGYTKNLNTVEKFKAEPKVAKKVKKKVKASEIVRYYNFDSRGYWDSKSKLRTKVVKSQTRSSTPLAKLADKILVLVKESESVAKVCAKLGKMNSFQLQRQWGIHYITVDEETHQKLINKPNVFCFSSFSFEKKKQNDLVKKFITGKLTQLVESQVRKCDIFKQLSPLAQTDLLSTSEKKLVQEISKYKIVSYTPSEEELEKVGLAAEYNKINNSHKAYKLVEKYEYLLMLSPISPYWNLNTEQGKWLKKIITKLK